MKRRIVLSVVSATAGLSVGHPASAQSCQPNWLSRFGPAGLGTSEIGSGCTVFDDDGAGPRTRALYVTGNFQRIGGIDAAKIARWDGRTWSALGRGLAYGGGSMVAYQPPDHSAPLLYVLGLANGLSTDVSAWDGSSWTPAASNTLTAVYPLGNTYVFPIALFVLDPDGPGPRPTTLYAVQEWDDEHNTSGGHWGMLYQWDQGMWVAAPFGGGVLTGMVAFDPDGSGPMPTCVYWASYTDGYDFYPEYHSWASSTLCRWDGTTAVTLQSAGSYRGLAVFDPDGPGPIHPQLYVTGDFPISGVGEHVRAAIVQGSDLASANFGEDGYFSRLQVVDDHPGSGPPALYATGGFTHIGGIAANGIARFDGSTWAAVGPGFQYERQLTYPRSLCAFDDDGPGPRTTFVYATGEFDRAGYSPSNGLARWDGLFWEPPGAVLNNQVGALLPSSIGGGSSIYVGGSFTSADGLLALGVARWDGSAFSNLGVGVNGPVNALVEYQAHIIAGGNFNWASGVSANHVAGWDGAAWSALGSGLDGAVVSAAVFNNGSGPALFVSGEFSHAGGVQANRMARWNGSAWTGVGAGTDAPAVALCVHAGSLCAAGPFTTAGGAAAPGAAAWDGSAWRALPRPPVAVSTLASHRGVLYAGGAAPNGSAAVCALMGDSWFTLPSLSLAGAPASVTALASVDEDGAGPGLPVLYASGRFDHAGTVPAPNLARWDGLRWSSVAGGLSAPALALSSFDGGGAPTPVVVFGGQFLEAGGQSSWFLATYRGCPNSCAVNCDGSTAPPALNVNDFLCFMQKFAAGDPYANCDGSSTPPVLNVGDFVCFQQNFAAGCP